MSEEARIFYASVLILGIILGVALGVFFVSCIAKVAKNG